MCEKLISEAGASDSVFGIELAEVDAVEPLQGISLSQLPYAISLHVSDAVLVCRQASEVFGSLDITTDYTQEIVSNISDLGVVVKLELEFHLSTLLMLLQVVREYMVSDETTETWIPSVLWSDTNWHRLQSDSSISEEWSRLVLLGKHWSEQAELFITCAENCIYASTGSSKERKLAFLDLHYGTGVFYAQTIGLDFAVWHNLGQYL
jgi:hypothetical protein